MTVYSMRTGWLGGGGRSNIITGPLTSYINSPLGIPPGEDFTAFIAICRVVDTLALPDPPSIGNPPSHLYRVLDQIALGYLTPTCLLMCLDDFILSFEFSTLTITI
jgi:hypothetical protein